MSSIDLSIIEINECSNQPIENKEENVNKPYLFEDSNFKSMGIKEFAKINNLPMQHIDFIDLFLLFPYVFQHKDQIPFIAGGFLRRWVQGEKLEDMTCDIDIYCRGNVFSSTERENYKSFIKNNYMSDIKDTDTGFQNACAKINLDNKIWEVQVMHGMFNITNDKIIDHLKTYDSFSSMFLYDMTTGLIHYHEHSVTDAKNKIYEFNVNCRSVSPYTQLQRIKKFSNEGYKFSIESDRNFMRWIVDNKNRIVDTDSYNQ